MTTAGHDPLAALITYNRRFVGKGRPVADVRLKLDKLAASPLAYLRGTFHAFVDAWRPGDDPLADVGPQPIVGDLHLENFGAFQASDGTLAFGINDFDDAGPGSPGFDLARLAASVVLAGDPAFKRAMSRVEALIDGWLRGVRDRTATPPAPRTVRRLFERAARTSREDWLARRVKVVRGERRFLHTVAYHAVEEPQRDAVTAAVHTWAKTCPDRPDDRPEWPTVLDVATRTAGTGSLGRLRWVVLLSGRRDKRGKELLLELKEARPSLLSPIDRAPATRIVTAQRKLQGLSPAFLGTARVGRVPCVVRELQPTQAKVQVEKLGPDDLDDLMGALGVVTGHAHRRCGPDLEEAIRGRDRAVLRQTAALALRHAEQLTIDHARLVAHKDEVAKALGV